MRLVVRQDDRVVNEFRFAKGPIYVGRHPNSQIFLPEREVSRQHAVIFNTQNGDWVIEDMDSANKTYLNNKQINKAKIKDGDVLRIVDFTIEVHFEKEIKPEKPIHLDDTLISQTDGQQIITRRLDSEYAPAMRLPAKRAKEFVLATEEICKADSLDKLLVALLHIMLKQFSAFHVWCALRSAPQGPMTCHAGKGRDGGKVELSDIKLKEKINQAVEKGQFLLLPRLPADEKGQNINSAMIAPIMCPLGCFGILYVDNAMDHEHYSLSDLDYLMLIAIHTAALLENI